MDNEHQLLIKQFQHFNIEIYGTYEDPLFKAKDIGDLLGIKKIRKTMENLDNDCKLMKTAPSGGGLQEQWFLTEDGVYEVLFISRKKIAKEFKKWVRIIIKEIRINSHKQLQQNNKQLQKQLEYYKEKTYEQTLIYYSMKKHHIHLSKKYLQHYCNKFIKKEIR